MALDPVSKIVFPFDRGGTWVKVDIADVPGGVADEVFYHQDGSEYYRKVIDGPVRISQCGIYPGTNMNAVINHALTHPDVHELHFDTPGADIINSGTLTGNSGFTRKLVFKNGCRLVGTGTLNGGIIECDHLQQCFGTDQSVVSLQNSVVSVRWFGAKADFKNDGTSGTWTDNLSIFNKALQCFEDLLPNVNFKYFKKLYIPYSDPEHYYAFSGTWIIDCAVEIYGDGIERTILKFPPNGKGLWLQFPDLIGHTVKGGRDQYLHDFEVVGTTLQFGAVQYDGTSHGIYIQTNLAYLQRIAVYRFNGDGFCFEATAPYTNANNCIADECRSYSNNGSGFYMNGPDGNQVKIRGGDASYNARWGVHDGSFLGCYMDGCHVATNGNENVYNRDFVSNLGNQYWCIKDTVFQVSHNGNRYICILAHNKPTTMSVTEPGVGSAWATYWSLVGAGGPSFQYVDWNISTWQDFTTGPIEPGVASNWGLYWEFRQAGGYDPGTDVNPDASVVKKWMPNTQWYTGGGYLLEDGNARGAMIECYAEIDQHMLTNTSNGLVFNGNAAMDGAVQGTIASRNGYVTSPNLQARSFANQIGWRINQVPDAAQTIMEFNDDVNFHAIRWLWDDRKRVIHYTEGWSLNPMMETVVGANTTFAPRIGRSAYPLHGGMNFGEGFFLGRDQDDNHKRFFGYGTAAPTTGEWADGDFVKNITLTNRAVRGWLCVTAGTPGTWVPMGFNEFALTDAATILTDASKASTFYVTLGGNRTMAAPTNPQPGQEIMYRIKQDATGGRTLTWDTVFNFSEDIPAPDITPGVGSWDYVKFQYNAVSSRWDVMGTNQGFI